MTVVVTLTKEAAVRLKLEQQVAAIPARADSSYGCLCNNHARSISCDIQNAMSWISFESLCHASL